MIITIIIMIIIIIMITIIIMIIMITKGLLQGADMSSATSSLELEDYPVQNLKVLQYWLRVKTVVKLWLPFFRYISETCKLYIYNICMFMYLYL